MSIWTQYLERLVPPEQVSRAYDVLDYAANTAFPVIGTPKRLLSGFAQQGSKLIPSDEGLKAAANRKQEEPRSLLDIPKKIVDTAIINPLDNLANVSLAFYRYPQAAAAVPWLYMNPDNPLYEDGFQLTDLYPSEIRSVYDSAFKQITPGQAAFALKEQVFSYINKSLGFNNSEPVDIWNPVEREYTFQSGPWKDNFEARLYSGGLDVAYSILLDPLNVVWGAGVGARTALLGKRGLAQGGVALQKILNRESTSVFREFVLNRDALAILNHPFVKGTYDPQATAAAFARVETPEQFELAMGVMLGNRASMEAAEQTASGIYDAMIALRGKTKNLQSELDMLRVTDAPALAVRNAENALRIHKEQMDLNISRYQFLDDLLNPESGVLWATTRGYQGTPFASIARLQARQADSRAKTIIGSPDEAPKESFILFRGSPLDETIAIGTRVFKDRPSGIIGIRGFPATEFTAEVQANLNRLPTLESPSTTVNLTDGVIMNGPEYKRDLLNRAVSAKTISERDAIVDELNEQIVKIKFAEEGLDFSQKLTKEQTEEAITRNLLYKNRTPATLEELIFSQMSLKQRQQLVRQSTGYYASYGEEALPVTNPVLASQLPNYRAIVSADELGRTIKAYKSTYQRFLMGRPDELGSFRGIGQGFLNLFDALWKPAILLRLGYPVRNAIEGLASASVSAEGIWHLFPTDSPLGPAEPMMNFVRNRYGDLKSTFLRQYISGKRPDPRLILELKNAGVEEASTFMKSSYRKIIPRSTAWHLKQNQKMYDAVQDRLIQLEKKVKEVDDDLNFDLKVQQQRIERIINSKNPIATMMKYPEYADELGKFDLEKVVSDANDAAISLGLKWKEQKAYVLGKRDEYMKYWEDAQETLLRTLKETYERNKETIEAGTGLSDELSRTIASLNEGLADTQARVNGLADLQTLKGGKYNRYQNIKKQTTRIPVLGEMVEVPAFGAGELGEFATAYVSSGNNWRFLSTNPAAFDSSPAMLNWVKKRAEIGRRTLYWPGHTPKQGELALEGVEPKMVTPQPTVGYSNFGVTKQLDYVPPSRENSPIANTEDDAWYALSEMAKFFKKDSVGKRLLAGESIEDVARFIQSRDLPDSQREVIAILSGDSYVRPYVIGKQSATRYATYVSDIMERTFPSVSARKKIAESTTDVIPPSQLRIWFDYERKNNLMNPIIGAELEIMNPNTMQKIAGNYRNGITTAFNYVGTIPEDNFVVGPFVTAIYNKSLANIMENYIKQGNKTIPADVRNKMQSTARRIAVSSRKKDLYNIIRYNGLTAGMGYIIPFVHAIDNTFRRWGRLIGRNPQTIRNLGLIWGSGERTGLVEKDENGNRIFTSTWDSPPEFTPEWVKSALKNGIQFPQAAINVALQGDPWFNPGANPIIQYIANDVLNRNPHIDLQIKDTLGVAVPVRWVFDLFVQNPTKDSIDLLLTPGIRRLSSIVGKTSADDYVADYVAIMESEKIAYRMGERDTIPTHEEVEARTTGLYMLRFGTAYGLPVPIVFKRPLSFYQDKARDYREKYGSDWEGRFYADWPDYFDMVYGLLENRANTPSTTNAIFQLNKHKELIAAIDDPSLGFNNKDQDYSDLISLITRQWGTIEEYDPHARNYLLQQEIAGIPIAELKTPPQVAADVQMKKGWLEWEQYKLKEEELLEQASKASIANGGSAVTSIRQKNAIYIDGNGEVRRIYDFRQDFLKAQEDPKTGNPTWLRNYQLYDAEGWKSSIKVMQMLTNHNDYINTSVTLKDRPSLQKAAMRFVEERENDMSLETIRDYLAGREVFVRALEQREAAGITGGGNIESKVNLDLEMEYNAWVENLKANGHPGFAEIYTRFLSQDKLKRVN